MVIGRCAPNFFPWQVNIAVFRWGFCADYVGKFASPSCLRFISFGFLLATTCVWVWMVCSLHSVTTGSRDRANVSLIIIKIIYKIKFDFTVDEGKEWLNPSREKN